MRFVWFFFLNLFGYILLLQVECCPSIVFHSVYFTFFFLSMCPFSFDWMYRPHVVCLDCFLFYFVGLSFLPPLHSLWFPVLDFHVCFHLLLLVLTCVLLDRCMFVVSLFFFSNIPSHIFMIVCSPANPHLLCGSQWDCCLQRTGSE